MTYNWKFKVSEHSLIYIYIISKIFLSSIMSCQSDFCRSSLKYSFTASIDSRLICKTSRKKEHFNALNAIGSHEIEIAASWKLQFFTLPSNSNKIAQKTRDKWATFPSRVGLHQWSIHNSWHVQLNELKLTVFLDLDESPEHPLTLSSSGGTLKTRECMRIGARKIAGYKILFSNSSLPAISDLKLSVIYQYPTYNLANILFNTIASRENVLPNSLGPDINVLSISSKEPKFSKI